MLSLHLHALERFTHTSRLVQAMTNELMTAICRSCVDVNQAVALPHIARSLQFVCGLGPRKADALIYSLQMVRAVTRADVRDYIHV